MAARDKRRADIAKFLETRNALLKSFREMRKQMKAMKGSLMGRMGLKQMEKRKAKLLKQVKKGQIRRVPGL